MTQTLITALNGKARPKNPQQGSTDCKYRPAPCCSDCECDHWDKFESTVKWHDCPEATEDGEYEAELIHQVKNECEDETEWVDDPYFGMNYSEYNHYRQVWRIVPQPQEKKMADNSTLDRLIKMIKEANYHNEQLIINLLEYNRK